MSVEIQGHAVHRIFGVFPDARLRRQASARRIDGAPLKLVADAACILSDATLDWMIANPGRLVSSPGGRSRAVVTDCGTVLDILVPESGGGPADGRLVPASEAELAALFSRKLRRRQTGLVLSTAERSSAAIEWALFKDVYKGVTDIVTRHVWPVPAFLLVRLFARVGITANMVTACGILLTILTAVLFLRQEFAGALAAGWLMTLFDTVDGKLARVTATSSRFGDRLDHIPDILHPPFWWACLAIGLVRVSHGGADALYASMKVILTAYVLGRVVEVAFKKRNGFNQYLWRPFDGRLRSVIARRNTILVILTVGLVLGRLAIAYHVAAVWSVLTIGIQPLRMWEAERERRAGTMPTPWLK